MISQNEQELLNLIRRSPAGRRPSWVEPWWNYVLMLAGGTMAVQTSMETGSVTAAAGGLMFGVGLTCLVVSVPLSRRLWLCYRLLRAADKADESVG